MRFRSVRTWTLAIHWTFGGSMALCSKRTWLLGSITWLELAARWPLACLIRSLRPRGITALLAAKRGFVAEWLGLVVSTALRPRALGKAPRTISPLGTRLEVSTWRSFACLVSSLGA